MRISASKIKTYEGCSWKYYCNYHLRLPEKTHPKTNLGSVVHLVLEILADPKHRAKAEKILETQKLKSVPSVCRLTFKHLKKLEIPKNIAKDAGKLIMMGINYDFFFKGHKKMLGPEYKFKIKIGKKHSAIGFLDGCADYGKTMVIRDYKTQKNRFTPEELDFNIQAKTYQLAMYKKHKKLARVEFLLLRHDDFLQACEPASKEELLGFECYLESMATFLEDFTSQKAHGQMASSQKMPKRGEGFKGPIMCGLRAKYPGQLKDNGEPMFHCAFKFSFEYFVLTNKKGDIILTSKNEEELEKIKKRGQIVEKKHYYGCPSFPQKYVTAI